MPSIILPVNVKTICQRVIFNDHVMIKTYFFSFLRLTFYFACSTLRTVISEWRIYMFGWSIKEFAGCFCRYGESLAEYLTLFL